MVEKVEKHVCKHYNVHRLTEQMFLWCKPNNIQVCIVTYGTVESKLCRQNYIIGNCDEFSLIYFTKFHIQKKNSRFCVHINYNHHIFSIKNFKIFIHMISLSVCVWYRIPKTVSLKVMLIWKYTWTKNKLSKIRWDVIYQWPKITLRGHETSLVVLRSSILILLLSVT